MGKLICLMGKSASGKDSIYQKLQETMPELKPLVLYTTRPMREGETEGVEYHFVSEEEYEMLQKAGKIIEERAYHTCLGLWRYFTVFDGSLETDEISYLMIGTPQAYEKMREYLGPEQVLPIYITLDDGERLQRALNREKAQKEPKYDEMCRRFLADEQDFSKEVIDGLGIEKSFYNDSLERCLSEVTAYIQGHR